jgi:hypothetical protein
MGSAYSFPLVGKAGTSSEKSGGRDECPFPRFFLLKLFEGVFEYILDLDAGSD